MADEMGLGEMREEEIEIVGEKLDNCCGWTGCRPNSPRPISWPSDLRSIGGRPATPDGITEPVRECRPPRQAAEESSAGVRGPHLPSTYVDRRCCPMPA